MDSVGGGGVVAEIFRDPYSAGGGVVAEIFLDPYSVGCRNFSVNSSNRPSFRFFSSVFVFCPNNVDSLPEFMSTNCPNWGGNCPPCPPVPYAYALSHTLKLWERVAESRLIKMVIINVRHYGFHRESQRSGNNTYSSAYECYNILICYSHRRTCVSEAYI